ncbi:BHMG1 [Branchiostoma lanceolatum]|uniref:BHMG1 protein n=1 Tax=Branchiostoma lanceolatum TaxID=7740 RepID=A0A8K0ETH9_BRALA|nr:BHMG1 [Branchiostoma lanceolatum]
MAGLLPVSEDGQKQTKCRVLQQSIQYIDWLHMELKMAYTDLGIEPCTARVSLKDVCRELGVSPAILTMSPSVLSYDLHMLAKHIEGRCLHKYCSPKLEQDPCEGTSGDINQMAGNMAGPDYQHDVQPSCRDADFRTDTLTGEALKSEASPCRQTENITTPKQSRKRWLSHGEARPRRKTKPKRCCAECLEDTTPRRELGWTVERGRRLDRSVPFPHARRALFSSEDKSSTETTAPDDDDSSDRFSAFFQPEKLCSDPRRSSPQQVVPMNLDKTDAHSVTPALGSSDLHPPDKDSVVPEAEDMPYSKTLVDDFFKISPFGRPSSCPPCYSATMAAPSKTYTPPIWKNLNEQSIFDMSNSSVDTLHDGSFAGQFLTSGDEADKEANQEVPSEDRDEDRGSGTRRRRFSYGRAKNKKKCVNGFIMFCKIVREKHKQRYSGYASTQISTMMGRKWAAMSPAERKPYKDAAYEFSLRNNRNVIVQKSLLHDVFDLAGVLGGTSSASTTDSAGLLHASPVSSVVLDACVPVAGYGGRSRENCTTVTTQSDASGDAVELKVT